MRTKSMLCCLLALAGQVAAFSQEITEEWVKAHYAKREVMIEMRDSVRLFTSIYEPRDTTLRRPILMTRTPYSCMPYGEDYNRGLWRSMQHFARDLYILVFQDVRGKNLSEGDFENVRPFNPNKQGTETDEASDSFDTVEWLVNHTACNGCVGAFGVSYPGFYATMVGLSGHPAVKAVSPQAPVTDWWAGDDVHHNGAFMLIDTYGFSAFFDRKRKGPGVADFSTYVPDPRFTNDIYGDYLRMGALPHFTESYGDSIAFWPDVVAHPNLDDWWLARDPRNYCYDVRPAVLVVGGLFDAEDLFGAWYLYRAIREKSPQTPLYLTMGPWSHGAWHIAGYQSLSQAYFGPGTAEWFMDEVEYPFFSYYLDGRGEAPQTSVNVFYTGTNQWRTYDAWPLTDAEPTPLYLQAGGLLSWDTPTVAHSCTAYTSDPAHPVPYSAPVEGYRNAEYMAEDQRFAARRPDVISFTGAALTDTLTLAGPVDVEIEVAISTTDADFVVKLIDVFPDGYAYPDSVAAAMPDPRYPMGGAQMLVRGDIMRGKYRDSMSDPTPFTPGEVTTVRFRMPDVAHTFLPGHKLMVQVQSSWFPLADINPQTFCDIYTAPDEAFTPCRVEVHHSAGHASRIVLPVLK